MLAFLSIMKATPQIAPLRLLHFFVTIGQLGEVSNMKVPVAPSVQETTRHVHTVAKTIMRSGNGQWLLDTTSSSSSKRRDADNEETKCLSR